MKKRVICALMLASISACTNHQPQPPATTALTQAPPPPSQPPTIKPEPFRLPPITPRGVLRKAIEEGDVERATQLIERGEVAVNDSLGVAGVIITPLIQAIVARQPALVAMLIAHGADVNAPGGLLHEMPLRVAIDQGDTRVIELLQQAGAR